jgi:hypothetical protein
LAIPIWKHFADKKGHEFIEERERETTGFLEPKAVRDSARKPLTAHLDDYVADLTARGRDDRGGHGVRSVASRINALLKDCDWQVPCNVTADSFIVWHIHEMKEPKTLLDVPPSVEFELLVPLPPVSISSLQALRHAWDLSRLSLHWSRIGSPGLLALPINSARRVPRPLSCHRD